MPNVCVDWCLTYLKYCTSPKNTSFVSISVYKYSLEELPTNVFIPNVQRVTLLDNCIHPGMCGIIKGKMDKMGPRSAVFVSKRQTLPTPA